MKILIVGENHADYLAKCHEALRTGLRRAFDARPFGRGYPNFDPSLRNYAQIITHVFPEGPPDLIFTEFELSSDPRKLAVPYAGLADLGIPSAILLGDFWNVTENCPDAFLSFLESHRIAAVLCYFPPAVEFFEHSWLAAKGGGRGRFRLLLPTFDPALFTDWKLAKQYDVGFLAAGTTELQPFYPERFRIHQQLLGEPDLKYLWARHPGWQRRTEAHPLVGEGFSRAINSCRMFITTSGRHRHPNPKYLEILASRSALLADEPVGAEDMGLRDGVNYVRISEEDVVPKIHYLLEHPEIAERIAEAGYRMAHDQHSCMARSREFGAIFEPLNEGREGESRLDRAGCPV